MFSTCYPPAEPVGDKVSVHHSQQGKAMARQSKSPPPEGRGATRGSRPSTLLGHGFHHAVEEEIRRRIAGSPGGHLVAARLDRLSLRFAVNLNDSEAGAEELADVLEQTITRYVEDAIEEVAAFRPGRAFCHRCESADCEHAVPPGPRSVFAGYSPTGFPKWSELGQLCLDHRHPQVDRLYDERPAILTLEVSGADLTADLLPEFHRSAQRHDVAAQLCAGLFPLPGLGPQEKGLALTFQAVATQRQRGRRRVGLNILGGGPQGEAAMADAAPTEKPWHAAVVWAQAQFVDISRRAQRGGAMPAEVFQRRVDGVLQGLARRIERGTRGRDRRTKHAEQRHQSGERPTRKAIDDLRQAPETACFQDSRNGTLVILGSKGRTHFFAPEGRLVSSVHYPTETIEKKIRLGHWKPAAAQELGALRERVEESTKGSHPETR